MPASVAPLRRAIAAYALRLGAQSWMFFRFDDEVARIEALRGLKNADAVVLFAARMQEGFTIRACDFAGFLEPELREHSLDALHVHGLIPRAHHVIGSALKRLGNEVRHLSRPMKDEDAVLALACLERTLAWYFNEFVLSPERGGHLREDGTDWVFPDAKPARDTLRAIAASKTSDSATERALFLVRQFPMTPFPAATLAEFLNDAGRYDDALALCRDVAASPVGEGDRRLRQMEALALSRTGRLDEALELLLQPKCPTYILKDFETIGIRSGIYKRRWDSDRSRGHDLEKARGDTLQGWEKSRQKGAGDTYLGINAAALAGAAGDGAKQRSIAGEVLGLLEARRDRIRGLNARLPAGSTPIPLGYWDAASIAEALLLTGRVPDAVQAYRQAFAEWAHEPGMLQSTKAQLRWQAELLAWTDEERDALRALT